MIETGDVDNDAQLVYNGYNEFYTTFLPAAAAAAAVVVVVIVVSPNHHWHWY
jgi:hypothetical protein